jgi:hypothetical protein
MLARILRPVTPIRSAQLASNTDPCACAYVRTEILGYLATQPRACDTLDGIVRWWIFDQRRRVGRVVVEQALDELVQIGSVERLSRADGPVLYRAAVPPSSSP